MAKELSCCAEHFLRDLPKVQDYEFLEDKSCVVCTTEFGTSNNDRIELPVRLPFCGHVVGAEVRTLFNQFPSQFFRKKLTPDTCSACALGSCLKEE